MPVDDDVPIEVSQFDVFMAVVRDVCVVCTGFSGAPLLVGMAYNAYRFDAQTAYAHLFYWYTLMTTWVAGSSALLMLVALGGMLWYASRFGRWLYTRHFWKSAIVVTWIVGMTLCGWLLKLLVVLTHRVPWDHRFSRADGGWLGWIGGGMMHDGDYTRGFRITAMNVRYGAPLFFALVGATLGFMLLRAILGVAWRRAMSKARLKAEERAARTRERMAALRRAAH